ncbi:MAG: hypothetical protein R2755_12685 [Acidimicrobiales bacterium]
MLAATRHCTTILVSHRFQTVRRADRICVLEGGRVVETEKARTTSAGLGGRYRAMFRLQASRFVEEWTPTPGGCSMTRSEPDPIEPLPPAGRSLWRMFQLGWQHERPLLALSLAMTLLTMLPDALLAWWLRLLVTECSMATAARCSPRRPASAVMPRAVAW